MAKKKQQGSAGAARRRQRKAQAVIETRAKKEFTYRGKTLPELQKLGIDEMLTLLPSRSRRSYARGLQPEERKFLERFDQVEAGKKVHRTHYRHIPVLPRMVEHNIAVYDGREFREFTVQPEMIGHRLGEFANTTRQCKHSGVGVGATRSSKHVPLK